MTIFTQVSPIETLSTLTQDLSRKRRDLLTLRSRISQGHWEGVVDDFKNTQEKIGEIQQQLRSTFQRINDEIQSVETDITLLTQEISKLIE